MRYIKIMTPSKQGFTLIEVLIALAILSIALTAILQTVGQNVRDTHYIQNKTFALWVGTSIINEIRAGLVRVPESPDKKETNTALLGQSFFSEAYLEKTPNPKIQKIVVNVYPTRDDPRLIQLIGYLYAQ